MAVFRLSEKISISIFLLIVFFGSLATISTFLLTKRILVNNASDEFSTIGPYRAYVASHLIRNYLNNVTNIANDPVIKDYLALYETDPSKAVLDDDELLGNDIGKLSLAIYILNKDGVAIASTDKRFINENYSFRDYYKKALRGQSHVDIAIGVTTKEKGFYFSSPVYAKNSAEVIGVVVYKLNPEVFSEELFGVLPKDYEFSLVDEFGVIVLSSDTEKVFGSLSKLSESSINKITELKRYDLKEITTLDYPELLNFLPEAGTDSSKLISLEDSFDKTKETTTLYKIDGTQFYLMVEQDTSYLITESLKSASMVASFVAIAALVSILIIGIIIKVFLSPLDLIANFAKKIGEGEVGKRIEINNNDEFSQLGEVISDMSVQLGEYRDNMEMKVKERTAEIEKFMDLMLGRELRMMELKKEVQKLKENKKNES